MTDIISQAIGYCSRGWGVLQLARGDKRPLGPWKQFQDEPASPDEVRGWFEQSPDSNVGVLTGTVSGLAVIDIDDMRGAVRAVDGRRGDTGNLSTRLAKTNQRGYIQP